MHKNDSTPIKAIDFKSLQEKTGIDSEYEQTLVSKKLIVWLVFLFIFAGGISVFLFLPNYVAEKQAPSPISAEIQSQPPQLVKIPVPVKIPEPAVQEIPNISAEELNALKLQAENLLLQVIKKQEALESQGVKKWANDEFLQAVSLGATGDEHFRKQHFNEAINAYEQAIDALQHLEELIAPTLTKHLQQGELALTQGESDAAVYHFELAKEIDAHNIQAQNGLKRAETIQELFILLEKGGNLEAANRLGDAKQTYQQATDLDPLSPEAKAAMIRVTARLKEIELSRLIARGYSSLEARQYGDARSAFISAQKLAPSSKKPKQGLIKVEQAVRNEKISSLTVEANHFESNEEWAYAVQSYQQILALSPSATIAIDGIARSQQRASLLSKLDNYLDNEERLSSSAVSTEARDLLQEIALLENPGTKIDQRANALEKLLQLTNQPISINLQSDNQTEVVIYKVGKFGRFENQKIELKPGKYTIVGSRPGYRDVRKILTISANMATKNIMVRCEEPI